MTFFNVKLPYLLMYKAEDSRVLHHWSVRVLQWFHFIAEVFWAAAAKQSLIKSWICYSMIFRLEPLHNWFMHRTHFLYELNTQLDLKLTRLPWRHFKLTGKFLNYVSSYNKYNRRTFTRKISVVFVSKWPPLTPVMTCLILAGAVRKITKSRVSGQPGLIL